MRLLRDDEEANADMNTAEGGTWKGEVMLVCGKVGAKPWTN